MKLLSSIIFSLVLLLGVGFVTHQVHAQVVAGCATTAGYNPTTGMSCNGITTAPYGCTATSGFNSTNGTPCNNTTAAANGYNGSILTPNGYLNGCTSTAGYSATTGYPCNTTIAGVVTGGVATSAPVVTDPGTSITSPGLPTTGAGGNAPVNLALLLGAGLVAFFGIRYSIRHAKASA